MSLARLCCAVMLIVFLQPLPAQQNAAQDWPVFRGNGAQTGVANSTLPDDLALRWTYKAQDAVQGAPVIVDQTVFIGALDGKLVALDLANGKKKWEYQAGPIKAAPAVRDGAVYVGDVQGTFHCVGAAHGKQRWTMTTRGEIQSPANFAQDRILFGSYDHHLYCVTSDGKLVWQCKTREKLHGAPAVAGERIFVGGCDQNLHMVDLAKGQELSVIPLGGHIGASVAVAGDLLYVGSMANQFLAVDWKKGAILWQFEAKRGAQPFYSSAAVTDELVIAGSRDKHLRAWQRQTGKEVWAFATKGRVDSSPVVVGQRVVVGSLDGHLYVLDLTRGTELARFELGAIAGSPAVGGQCIVVATFAGEIHCLGAKK